MRVDKTRSPAYLSHRKCIEKGSKILHSYVTLDDNKTTRLLVHVLFSLRSLVSRRNRRNRPNRKDEPRAHPVSTSALSHPEFGRISRRRWHCPFSMAKRTSVAVEANPPWPLIVSSMFYEATGPATLSRAVRLRGGFESSRSSRLVGIVSSFATNPLERPPFPRA